MAPAKTKKRKLDDYGPSTSMSAGSSKAQKTGAEHDASGASDKTQTKHEHWVVSRKYRAKHADSKQAAEWYLILCKNTRALQKRRQQIANGADPKNCTRRKKSIENLETEVRHNDDLIKLYHKYHPDEESSNRAIYAKALSGIFPHNESNSRDKEESDQDSSCGDESSDNDDSDKEDFGDDRMDIFQDGRTPNNPKGSHGKKADAVELSAAFTRQTNPTDEQSSHEGGTSARKASKSATSRKVLDPASYEEREKARIDSLRQELSAVALQGPELVHDTPMQHLLDCNPHMIVADKGTIPFVRDNLKYLDGKLYVIWGCVLSVTGYGALRLRQIEHESETQIKFSPRKAGEKYVTCDIRGDNGGIIKALGIIKKLAYSPGIVRAEKLRLDDASEQRLAAICDAEQVACPGPQPPNVPPPSAVSSAATKSPDAPAASQVVPQEPPTANMPLNSVPKPAQPATSRPTRFSLYDTDDDMESSSGSESESDDEGTPSPAPAPRPPQVRSAPIKVEPSPEPPPAPATRLPGFPADENDYIKVEDASEDERRPTIPLTLPRPAHATGSAASDPPTIAAAGLQRAQSLGLELTGNGIPLDEFEQILRKRDKAEANSKYRIKLLEYLVHYVGIDDIKLERLDAAVRKGGEWDPKVKAILDKRRKGDKKDGHPVDGAGRRIR